VSLVPSAILAAANVDASFVCSSVGTSTNCAAARGQPPTGVGSVRHSTSPSHGAPECSACLSERRGSDAQRQRSHISEPPLG